MLDEQQPLVYPQNEASVLESWIKNIKNASGEMAGQISYVYQLLVRIRRTPEGEKFLDE